MTQNLVNLARQIAPTDLDGLPVYVVASSMLPGELQLDQKTLAMTGPRIHFALQDWLSSSNRWLGPGPAIVLNDVSLAEDASRDAGDDEAFRTEILEQRTTTYFLHELGHVLDRGIDTDETSPALTQFLKLQLSLAVADGPPVAPSVPFLGHDGRFVRVLSHVRHRGERLLKTQFSASLLFGGDYKLSNLGTYEFHLTDELEGFAGTFDELKATRPPEKFIKLWQADLRRWFLSQEPTKEVGAAFVKHATIFEGDI